MRVAPSPKNFIHQSQNSTSASTSHSLRNFSYGLYRAFTDVLYFLTKMGHRPFLKRYLKRDEILSDIASCDATLNEALEMFGVGFVYHCDLRDIRV